MRSGSVFPRGCLDDHKAIHSFSKTVMEQLLSTAPWRGPQQTGQVCALISWSLSPEGAPIYLFFKCLQRPKFFFFF